MTVGHAGSSRIRDRRLYVWSAFLLPLLVLAGFARTYYLKGFFSTPDLPSVLVHLHGAVMTAWVVLFIVQVWLISAHRVRVHQRLGYAGVALAVVVVGVGFATAVASAARGNSGGPIPPLVFLVVPIFDLVVFTILFGFAIAYRRRPETHKRLMLLTVFNFLPPAIARIPLAWIAALGPLSFFGIPDVLALASLAFDTWRHRRLSRAFALGTLLLVASHPIRFMIGGTMAWAKFANWLVH